MHRVSFRPAREHINRDCNLGMEQTRHVQDDYDVSVDTISNSELYEVQATYQPG